MIEKSIYFKIFALLSTLVVAVEPANILGVFNSNSPSHQIIHMAYVKGLIERGHNVTVVTTTPLKDKNPGYLHIHTPQTEERSKIIDAEQQAAKNVNMGNTWTFYKHTVRLLKAIGGVHHDAIKSEKFQELMHNPGNKFDLILLGVFFSDYQFGLGEHFNCPIIVSGVNIASPYVNRMVGNPPEIPYSQSLLQMTPVKYKTFWGRLLNFFSHITQNIFLHVVDSHMNEVYTELFPPSKYPPLKEAAKRVSLLFINDHFSEGRVRPLVPATILVGGIQIKDKPDPLPEDFQKIINSSQDGVVYVSFGSNVKSEELGPVFTQNLFKALSSLKQTVVWKWDGLEKPGDSPNIHYLKWIPQDDLLAQKNVKLLFVTHGGKGSVAESQFHGVPMLVIPFFGDQIKNGKEVTSKGFGLELDKQTATEESIRATILEVLENPKYADNIRRFSQLYRDRPMSAKETAMFWIEYVLRHKGAYHMRSPALDLNSFQYWSLDVIGFLLLLAFTVFKAISITVKFVIGKVSNLRSKEVKIKHN